MTALRGHSDLVDRGSSPVVTDGRVRADSERRRPRSGRIGTSVIRHCAVAVSIVGVLLTAAGCGGDDKSPATGGGSSASSDAPSPDAGSLGATSAVGDFCSLNEELARLFGELAGRTGDDAEATWLNIEIAVGWIQEEAPEELAEDVAHGAEYYAALGEALRAADFDDPVAVVESVPEGTEIEGIEARIDDYLDESC